MRGLTGEHRVTALFFFKAQVVRRFINSGKGTHRQAGKDKKAQPETFSPWFHVYSRDFHIRFLQRSRAVERCQVPFFYPIIYFFSRYSSLFILCPFNILRRHFDFDSFLSFLFVASSVFIRFNFLLFAPFLLYLRNPFELGLSKNVISVDTF